MNTRKSILLGTLLGLLVTLDYACSTPVPVPDPPGPSPTDVFDGAVINCELPAVESEASQLITPVRRCLVGEATSSCLVGLTNSYHVDSVACEVRLQGHLANRRVLAGQPGPDDVTVDEAARTWLASKKVGYR